MKVLLLPDRPDWAFDRKAKGIVGYNSDPRIKYSVQYVINGQPINWNDWNVVVVFFVMEYPAGIQSQKTLRNCFSARWLTGDYARENVAEMINTSRAVVIANHFIYDGIKDLIKVPVTIIEDAADPKLFYPKKLPTEAPFTALFAGNASSPIKRFHLIQRACVEAGVTLRVVSGLPLEAMNDIYNRADVLVNFGLQEGGPVTMPEAALCGVPTIIPIGVGLSDRMPCFAVKGYVDLVNILKRLKANPKEAKQKGWEARQKALRCFTSQIMSDKYAKCIMEMFGQSTTAD